MGSIAVPMAHELCHVFTGSHTETLPANGGHEHPDFDAFGDLDNHTQEAELTCVLCSLSVHGVHTFGSLAAHSTTPVVHFGGALFRVEDYSSSFSIRGPPVHMTLS